MANEKGIAVTIKGFIPVNPQDLEGHSKAIAVALQAKNGDFAALKSPDIEFRVEEFSADPVTRRSKDTASE
ncbi:hypothetical protein I6H96_02770 [Brucella anthropi]|uniref:hypothetical protein n=1 Tax=Brucella anthropi TaxID=529 RepID=UPI0002D365AF|nr:hypothetical protein [Brucella anthropi]NKC48156.1 hypothetical protein [Brucella anthropi ATCC 49188]QQC25804.1 hypothetical protein I6H96_02770 [Brucella anthropi]SUA65370.1 Uncharacterised protein [Brucella anthropi]